MSKCLRWIPVMIIAAILAWSYYAYVIHLCLKTVQPTAKRVVYLTLYHVLLTMTSWSYWRTTFTKNGPIPAPYKTDTLAISENLPIATRDSQGLPRFCDKCRIIKPDRSHHCSICQVCVLRMDHHCPWINNCVSFTNYKFFILFVGYALLYAIFVAVTCFAYLEEDGFHLVLMFFLAVVLGVCLVSLLVYHCYLVGVNRTTVELLRPPIFEYGPDKRGFSIGRGGNFREVFGDDAVRWFLPIGGSRGDGCVFPVRAGSDKEIV